MFAERKCCQVFEYESETFDRLRRNGISDCENGERNPQNLPFPLQDVDHHVIQQCIGPPHALPQTAAPTVEALSHTYAVKSPLDTMARRKFAPKSTPSSAPIRKLHYLPHPRTRPTYDVKRHPDPIAEKCTGQTDAPTDKSSTGKFDDYSPLRL